MRSWHKFRLQVREITLASDQVADSSQTLSQGATEQAASLEEISASLHQTSSQTTLNADNATQANWFVSGDQGCS